MSLLPESRWWHWIVYPVAGIVVATFLLIGVVMVTSG